MKRNIITFLPLLLYPVLLYPYKILNEKVLVERFGCSCPVIDEAGNTVVRRFNANSITVIFWTSVAVIAVVISALLARRCEKRWMRIAFPLIAAACAFGLSYLFITHMWWA